MSLYFEDEKSQMIYAKGILTYGLPVLVKTPNGRFTCPSIWVDEEDQTKICNFFSVNGVPGELYTVNKKGEVAVVKQTPKEEMKSPKRRTFSIRLKKPVEGYTWANIEVWEQVAVYVHQNCSAGDEVFIAGKKKVKTDQTDASKNEVININFLEIVISSKDRQILRDSRKAQYQSKKDINEDLPL